MGEGKDADRLSDASTVRHWSSGLVFEKYYATLQVLAWFRETGECQTITMPRT